VFNRVTQPDGDIGITVLTSTASDWNLGIATPPEDCDDGTDNDGDTLVDCDDSDCDEFFSCIPTDNHPPEAHCKNISVELEHGHTCVHVHPEDVDDASSDPDGDTLHLAFSLVDGVTPPDSHVAELCSLGDHTVTLEVADNLGEIDSCEATVTVTEPPVECGNGHVEAGEECDDGNTDDTDACTNACHDAACGDGITYVGVEECDDGNSDDTDACTNACHNAACGDGVVQAGVEQCDDGNTDNGDGCDSNCTATGCGNGIVTDGEECDDGNTNDTDACTNACHNAECGDGIVRAGVEQCDDGNVLSGDGCSASCEAEHEICGNCVDDDGDHLIDLLDPECDSSDLTLTKGTLVLKNEVDKDKISLKGHFPSAGVTIDPPTDGVTISLIDADGKIACHTILPGSPGWKVNRAGTNWSLKDLKDDSVGDAEADEKISIKLNAKTGRYEVNVNINEAELMGPDAGSIATSVYIGTQAWLNQQEWKSKAKGKKLVTP
jgi:cysteine-rich repeat protein